MIFWFVWGCLVVLLFGLRFFLLVVFDWVVIFFWYDYVIVILLFIFLYLFFIFFVGGNDFGDNWVMYYVGCFKGNKFD